MKWIRVILPLLAISVSLLTVLHSCKHTNSTCGETKISRAGEDESHHNGQNCMNCHSIRGKGEGCFVVGGSVYDATQTNPVRSGKIQLYTGPNGTGTMVTELAVDGAGNFYTTKQVNFGTGLYPAYLSSGGNAVYMSSVITNGQCGSCHGVTQAKIYIP
jgi:hypothetical protein